MIKNYFRTCKHRKNRLMDQFYALQFMIRTAAALHRGFTGKHKGTEERELFHIPLFKHIIQLRVE